MKKCLFIVFTLLSLAVSAQNEMEFMGIPLGLEQKEFIAQLEAKGYVQNTFFEGCYNGGPFWKFENPRVKPMSNIDNLVTQVTIFPGTDEYYLLERLFDDLKYKYGTPIMIQEINKDGWFEYFWETEGGIIVLKNFGKPANYFYLSYCNNQGAQEYKDRIKKAKDEEVKDL